MKKEINNNHIHLEELLKEKSNYASFSVDKRMKDNLAQIPFNDTTKKINEQNFSFVEKIKKIFENLSMNTNILPSRYAFSSLLLLIVGISGILIFYNEENSSSDEQTILYNMGTEIHRTSKNSDIYQKKIPMIQSTISKPDNRSAKYINEDGSFESIQARRKRGIYNIEGTTEESSFVDTVIDDGALQSSINNNMINEETEIEYSQQTTKPIPKYTNKTKESHPAIISFSKNLGNIVLEIVYSVIILIP